MSCLRELSAKYPDILPPGTTLQEASEIYLRLFEGKAKAYLIDTTLIVLQELHQRHIVRGWLLFDPFKKSTVTAMKRVIGECRDRGTTIYTSTADKRMFKILLNLGFMFENKLAEEYYLVLEV